MNRYITLSNEEIGHIDSAIHAHWERIYVDYSFPSSEEFTDRLAMCSNCKHVDGKYTYAFTKMTYRECPYCKAVMDDAGE